MQEEYLHEGPCLKTYAKCRSHYGIDASPSCCTLNPNLTISSFWFSLAMSKHCELSLKFDKNTKKQLSASRNAHEEHCFCFDHSRLTISTKRSNRESFNYCTKSTCMKGKLSESQLVVHPINNATQFFRHESYLTRVHPLHRTPHGEHLFFLWSYSFDDLYKSKQQRSFNSCSNQKHMYERKAFRITAT